MMLKTLLNLHSDAPATQHSARLHLPGSGLARFLELRGRRIVKACGAMWYLGPGRFLLSLPYHALLNPDPHELRHMIRENRAFGARFPSASWTGLESGLYVMNARDYDIDSVHENQRAQVLRGLECFNVRPATKAQMLSQGRSLNLSVMARQGTYYPEFGDRRRWETLVEAAFACSAISVPAAFYGSRLAAYMITCQEHRWMHILHRMSAQQDLPNSPNHVLTYTVTKQAAADDSIDAICYGCVSLGAAGSLDDFKLQFGYELIPHRSAIQLHPMLDSVLNCRLARAVVHTARSLQQEARQLKTIEAVLEGAHSSAPGRMVGGRPIPTS